MEILFFIFSSFFGHSLFTILYPHQAILHFLFFCNHFVKSFAPFIGYDINLLLTAFLFLFFQKFCLFALLLENLVGFVVVHVAFLISSRLADTHTFDAIMSCGHQLSEARGITDYAMPLVLWRNLGCGGKKLFYSWFRCSGSGGGYECLVKREDGHIPWAT